MGTEKHNPNNYHDSFDEVTELIRMADKNSKNLK